MPQGKTPIGTGIGIGLAGGEVIAGCAGMRSKLLAVHVSARMPAR